jgi:hypothetical protein
MQRVRDPERFLADLERPPPGQLRAVTDTDIEEDGRSFMAFAAAFGVKPPAAGAADDSAAALPSS